MITPSCRNKLSTSDITLIARLVWNDEMTAKQVRQFLTDELEMNETLDDPALVEFIRSRNPSKCSSALFFYVLVRDALKKHGVKSYDVADYVATMLIEFSKRDRAWKIDWHDDATFFYMTDLLQDIRENRGDRKLQLCAHLGNFPLWLAGLFPEFIENRAQYKGGPNIEYYENMSSMGFKLAAVHPSSSMYDLQDIYDIMAKQTSNIRESLNYIAHTTSIVS